MWFAWGQMCLVKILLTIGSFQLCIFWRSLLYRWKPKSSSEETWQGTVTSFKHVKSHWDMPCLEMSEEGVLSGSAPSWEVVRLCWPAAVRAGNRVARAALSTWPWVGQTFCFISITSRFFKNFMKVWYAYRKIPISFDYIIDLYHLTFYKLSSYT